MFEWTQSVLHAKALVVDESRMLIGSFNLDPLSLVNLEVLVDVEDPAVAAKGEAWIADHCVRSREINAQAVGGTALVGWLLDAPGILVVGFVRVLASCRGLPQLSHLCEPPATLRKMALFAWR